MKSNVNYNERSWAIDVITQINVYLHNKGKIIKSAGGENTIKNNKKSLFPDVLLYGDAVKGNILQGWELKMPDTSINNLEFYNNAVLKANLLRLNSFVLWNVKSAVLYHRINEDHFEVFYKWDEIEINNRGDVENNIQLWRDLLIQIIETLNNFFDSGEISSKTVIDSISLRSIVNVVLDNSASTCDNIKKEVTQSLQLDSNINLWWRAAETEYGKHSDRYSILSNIVLTDWVIKIVFANILTRYFNDAKVVYKINFETTIEEGLEILSSISDNCNFWNIFNPSLAQVHISDNAWNQLIQLNTFLSDFSFEEVDIEIIQDLMQSSVDFSKRKVAGQFATPIKLAEFLSRITILDKTQKVIDPCCGTGTIINEAYKLLKEYDIPEQLIEENIWASDKYSFPIQLSTLTLTKPENIGRVLKVFKSDVIDIVTGEELSFKNPNDGSEITIPIPQFKYVVSNLPFIQQESIKILNPEIHQINQWIEGNSECNLVLDGRSDIYAYIPFYLWEMIQETGKIGLILSNAFLGTKYGQEFLEIFQWFYQINEIVISGEGKWFNNADVVAAILTGTKKQTPTTPSENSPIKFVVIKSNINNIQDIKQLAENVNLGVPSDNLDIKEYQISKVNELLGFGFSWSALFGNVDWFTKINGKLLHGHEVFDFIRGERRGWNQMFYPPIGHEIEDEFIKPVLKNLRNSKGLICSPNKEAFCCSKSIDFLEENEKFGALKWIQSFQNSTNNIGKPLVEALARPGHYWYEMRDDSLADFTANINYGDSLFISMLDVRSFVDQRLIGLSIKEGYKKYNNILISALLNNILSLFFIESLGFGRGSGALDLNKTKFENNFMLLNPNVLSEAQTDEILDAYYPLLERDRLPLIEEIDSKDRIKFDKALLKSFGIENCYEEIKESLIKLYLIRTSVKE